MRLLLAAASAAALAFVGCGKKEAAPPPAPAATVDPSAELKGVADAVLAAATKQNPFAVYFGLSDVVKPDHAALPDLTPEGFAAFEGAEDRALEALSNIDESALEKRADWVLYRSLKEALEASVGLRVCRQPLWSVSHMTGWQTVLPEIADQQPTATQDERLAAFTRWTRIDDLAAADHANLERGLEQGYSAPKSVVRRVVAQFDALLAAPLDAMPYFAFARDSDDAGFKAAMKGLFEAEVIPALRAHRDFLRDVYLPKARDDIAISALPKGRECYEAMLRSYHSAKIGAEKTFERGKAAVEANRQGVAARGKALFGVEDFAQILDRVKSAPGNRFQTEEELVDFTVAMVPTGKDLVAPFFSRLPIQDMKVERYPDFMRGSGQSSSYEPKPASQGAATYRIATDEWRTQTKGEAEIVAVHEGWPGHHLQVATAFAMKDLHPVTRLASSTAFVEGWARYAEALAEEAEVYSNGYGEISRRAWPARGMVVDPGVHVFGWTRKQAADFLVESQRFTPKTVEIALDRIAVMPGQLTAYDTGGLEIFALRKEAEERLGAKFDIREFHDRVLENGAIPLGALREHVEKWIAEKEKA